jgi:hypothetical protein
MGGTNRKGKELKWAADSRLIQLHGKLITRSLADDFTEEEQKQLSEVLSLLELRGVLVKSPGGLAMVARNKQN